MLYNMLWLFTRFLLCDKRETIVLFDLFGNNAGRWARHKYKYVVTHWLIIS